MIGKDPISPDPISPITEPVLTKSKIPSGKANVTHAFGESTTAPTWLSTGAADNKMSRPIWVINRSFYL